jgi:demethoxyubiquinone hydroxylase (CLK1/Coq7/Cat5 family)
MNSIQAIDSLLQNELSALETYQQALDTLSKKTELGELDFLMSIYDHHKEAALSLRDKIHQLGGVPSQNSGAWGACAKIIQASANLLGKQAAFKVLREGELTGAEEYEKALTNRELPSDIRLLIETKLLPAQQKHMRTLDNLLDRVMA